jgi:methyltransferase (TIGR00027 family)
LTCPRVFGFKEAVLAACGAPAAYERAVVPVDLRGRWADPLLAAGLDRAAPTAWLAEGLLIYPTADEAERLLTDIGQLSAPGSRLATHASRSRRGRRLLRPCRAGSVGRKPRHGHSHG